MREHERKEYLYRHAADRAWERYGVTIDQFSYTTLNSQINNKDASRAKLVADNGNGKQIWRVLHGNKWLLAATRHGVITTFLSESDVKNGN